MVQFDVLLSLVLIFYYLLQLLGNLILTQLDMHARLLDLAHFIPILVLCSSELFILLDSLFVDISLDLVFVFVILFLVPFRQILVLQPSAPPLLNRNFSVFVLVLLRLVIAVAVIVFLNVVVLSVVPEIVIGVHFVIGRLIGFGLDDIVIRIVLVVIVVVFSVGLIFGVTIENVWVF